MDTQSYYYYQARSLAESLNKPDVEGILARSVSKLSAKQQNRDIRAEGWFLGAPPLYTIFFPGLHNICFHLAPIMSSDTKVLTVFNFSEVRKLFCEHAIFQYKLSL